MQLKILYDNSKSQLANNYLLYSSINSKRHQARNVTQLVNVFVMINKNIGLQQIEIIIQSYIITSQYSLILYRFMDGAPTQFHVTY